MPSHIDEAGHTKAFDYPVAEHWGESQRTKRSDESEIQHSTTYATPTPPQPEGTKVAVRCQLDSGATCSIMPYEVLCKILQTDNPPIKPSSTRFKMFNCTTENSMGCARLHTTVTNKKWLLHFEIVREGSVTLLSGSACETLNLIRFNQDELTWYIP